MESLTAYVDRISMVNGVSCVGDEDLSFQEEEEVKSVKYTAKIAQCVIAQAIDSHRLNSTQHGKVKLWYDSMASHSITNDKALFGAIGPGERIKMEVLDWKEESMIVTEAGRTCFGPMLYSEHAGGTILSARVMCEHNVVMWNNDIDRSGDSNVCVNKFNPNIRLTFDTDNPSGVLETTVSNSVYKLICNSAPNANFGYNVMDKGVISSLKASSIDFNKGLEAIHFHKCTCHASMTTIASTCKAGILTGMPFQERHIHKMNIISNGKCPCCVAAKSAKIRVDPRRKSALKLIYPEMRLPDEVEERFKWIPDISDTGESLGLDLM